MNDVCPQEMRARAVAKKPDSFYLTLQNPVLESRLKVVMKQYKKLDMLTKGRATRKGIINIQVIFGPQRFSV